MHALQIQNIKRNVVKKASIQELNVEHQTTNVEIDNDTASKQEPPTHNDESIHKPVIDTFQQSESNSNLTGTPLSDL